jgi:hypothetical protein
MLGDNAQAHDLALGLFLSWFPILILSSIVDRNPVASDDIRRKLNKLVDLVCESLQDPGTRGEFIDSFQDMPEAKRMSYWVNKISLQAPHIKNEFFTGFAGQGRIRFHYGAAHAILIDIEKSYIADHGRGWLSRHERSARASLVLGLVDNSFVWFDGRQFWQVSSSVLLVVGTSAGAFILSYFTPTAGLGCRTGGYVIYITIAFFLLLSELLIWILTSPVRKNEVNLMVRQSLRTATNDVQSAQRGVSFPGLVASKATLSWLLSCVEGIVVAIGVSLARVKDLRNKKGNSERVEAAIRAHFATLHALTTREWSERLLFTPLEFINLVWLCYLIMAQTVGAFVNCDCQTSIWGPGGGYLDFTQWNYTNNAEVGKFWVAGTVVSSVFMGIGMFYVALEWCIQAHLCTENYKDAMIGLKRVRRFRRFTVWIRYPASLLVLVVNNIAAALNLRKSGKRKSLLWTKDTTHKSQLAQPAVRPTMETQSQSFRDSPIEGQDEEKDAKSPGEIAAKHFDIV